MDPSDLAARLGGKATVVVIPTGEATWALTEALPDMLDVYGGAVRIWWPGANVDSVVRDHPLYFARSPEEGARVVERVIDAILPPGPPPQTPWQRVTEEYAVGDVVWGVVQNTKTFGVFVELIPGFVGIVPKGEVDWTFVADPADFVKPGQQVAVQILSLDPATKRAGFSIKRAWNRTPRPPIAPVAGGRPLISDVPTADQVAVVDADAIADLKSEIETLREGRAETLRRLTDAQKELRSARDRLSNLDRQGGGEPTSSETTFLECVRVAYARLFGEGERCSYPLRRMRVGSEFLSRLRALDGISTDKVVEVCVQVASGRAHEIPGREVHLFGARGSPALVRSRDGAKAWRCSLQDATASARRLHWWQIPGPDGGTVEFASVGTHDDYAMPE
ncbi:MAG: S1 RNA-binding domain-containing protein [Planctomycetes bacterium]|nr:S1 RNA-binding domain-containing protein [Planctomycetota bacterium]